MSMKKKETCQLHTKSGTTVNRTLISLILCALLMVVYHVWVYHHEAMFSSFSKEIWSLIFGRGGLLMELKEVFIYFLIGIMIAGYIRTYKLHIRLRKLLIKYGFSSIFLAALIGVFTPLCSCGILTTVVSLLAAGLPLAPAMALLISAPLMSPTTFFLTINDLGVQWAVVRVLVAFLMGVLAGVVTYLLSKKGFETGGLFLEGGIPDGDFHDPDYPDQRLRCTCNEKFSNRIARKTKNKLLIFLAKTTEMFWLVGKYVLVGIMIGCIIENYIPHTYLYKLFGQGGNLSPIWVTLGSIPLFLHQISASSILYHIKLSLPGIMDTRSALAFLIGGPVTAIPAMILLWSMFKKRVFVLYMAVSVLGTIFFAYTVGSLLFVPYVNVDSPVLANVSSLAGGKSAIISKSSQSVRIAVAPDQKPVVAYYEDLEGGSGVVFDGSLNRFKNEFSKLAGNRNYIKNIARWLMKTSVSSQNNRILIYNTYQDNGLDNQSFQDGLSSILTEKGEFEVDIFARGALPFLTSSILQDYDQLWVLSGQADALPFSKEEVRDICNFHEDGHSLLIVAGPGDPADGDWTGGANQLAANFGVHFSSAVNFQDQIPVSVLAHLSEGVSRILFPYFRWLNRARD